MAKRVAKSGDPKVAVASLRTSTPDQTNGLEAQRADIERWAAREGVTIASWHVDHISGASQPDARPGLMGALADVEAFGAGVVVVAKRCRLARDIVVGATIESLVRALGAKVAAADGVGAQDTPEARLLASIVDAFSSYERALIRARTCRALQAKKARGERTGGVPLGSRVAEGGVRLEVHDGERRAMLRARELRAEGRSLRAVASALAGEGILSRANKPFAPTSVRALLAG